MGNENFEKYNCPCGYVYDEAEDDPENGIAKGTKWADVREDWRQFHAVGKYAVLRQLGGKDKRAAELPETNVLLLFHCTGIASLSMVVTTVSSPSAVSSSGRLHPPSSDRPPL